MAIERLPLLQLNSVDEEVAYLEARKAFAGILLSRPIVDPMGRRILFKFGHRDDPDRAGFCQPLDPPVRDSSGRIKDDCWHVCFKESGNDKNRYSTIPRDRFVASRAARIPWILTALTDPDTRIHESPSDRERERLSYSLWLPGDPKAGVPTEFFTAITRQPGPTSAEFVTAYSLDAQRDLERLRALGPQLYPAKAKQKKKVGRK